ncbi:PREDICTED: receptor-like kinase TMK2 [Camelina sativa]|uniref:Receptor-like kinase TMK2 n=1 Tax=Camelina sativa TaxID=90675 RepID=A0ABM0WPG2_CAMSA|nr:PREDICTED: receptor-like kinase TMK2 [Camelina sativa]
MEQLRRMGAGYFSGGMDPSVADEWRERMEDIFQSLRCPDRHRVDLAVIFFWLCLLLLVKGELSLGSNRDTLLSILREFGLPRDYAESWKSDDTCNWYGILCLDGQIKAIRFTYMNLTGTISPKFADITSLTLLDLSHNSLTGTIPWELTKLNLLSILDLSYNQLHGKVPQFKTIAPHVEGNPGIINTTNIFVPSHTGNKKRSVSLGLLIGILAVGLLIIGGGFVALYLLMRSKRADRQSEPNEALELTQQSFEQQVFELENRAFPLQVLKNATDDFSHRNIVGRGGFGVVYKGILQDGLEVAIKRMEQPVIGGIGADDFRSEVRLLTKVHHRNLVTLHGYCLDGNDSMFVYEYMPQGTLSRHLFDWKDQGLRQLDWTRRLLIALDVARGVEYLHTLARQSQSYIHRDLKPSNILLGEDLRAKVSDFGLLRSIEEGRESIRTKYVGTFGYIAPEYTSTGRLTRKVDVYSYGVILMELLTGQNAIDEARSDTHIATWFRKMVFEKDSLAKAIDNIIEVDEETRRSIQEVAELACHCCSMEPEERPEMSHVVSVLASVVEQWEPNSEVKVEKEKDINKTYQQELARRWQTDLEASSSCLS